MLLQTGKLQYNEGGVWKQLEAPSLISLDVAHVNSQSRDPDSRVGSFTNETLNSIEIQIKRGTYSYLDGLKPHDKILLKYTNGAFSIQGTFNTSRKINLTRTDCFISFSQIPEESYIFAARGGEGGHVDDVEVNGISVVSSGVAEINLLPYAKTTDLDKKLSLSGGTMDTYAQISMHSGRIVDLAEPTGNTHAATKKYADTKVAKADGTIEFTLGVDASGVYIVK